MPKDFKQLLSPAKIASTAVTPKGFTQHEHLNQIELIHMNGRVFDYNLGRFTGVDPFIQSPLNSQSLNPYSYIMNNPLSGTDPTGYMFRDECNGRQSCEMQRNPLSQLQAGINAARGNIGSSGHAPGRWRNQGLGSVIVGPVQTVAANGAQVGAAPNGSGQTGTVDSNWRPQKLQLVNGTDSSKLSPERLTALKEMDDQLINYGPEIDARLQEELAKNNPDPARVTELRQLQHNYASMVLTMDATRDVGPNGGIAEGGNSFLMSSKNSDGVYMKVTSFMNFYRAALDAYTNGAEIVSGTMPGSKIRTRADLDPIPKGVLGVRALIYHESAHTIPQLQVDFKKKKQLHDKAKESNAESFRRFMERKGQ